MNTGTREDVRGQTRTHGIVAYHNTSSGIIQFQESLPGGRKREVTEHHALLTPYKHLRGGQRIMIYRKNGRITKIVPC